MAELKECLCLMSSCGDGRKKRRLMCCHVFYSRIFKSCGWSVSALHLHVGRKLGCGALGVSGHDFFQMAVPLLQNSDHLRIERLTRLSLQPLQNLMHR